MLKSTRTTEQGRGPKCLSFLKLNNKFTPSPTEYNLTTVFDDNIRHNIGFSMQGRLNDINRNKKYCPGVGSYNLRKDENPGYLPITIKSRNGFYYDDDIKKKKFTVSMQRYRPLYDLVERRRFDGVGFGYGNKMNNFINNGYPGPGTYKVPSIFDRGLKGKLVLN